METDLNVLAFDFTDDADRDQTCVEERPRAARARQPRPPRHLRRKGPDRSLAA